MRFVRNTPPVTYPHLAPFNILFLETVTNQVAPTNNLANFEDTVRLKSLYNGRSLAFQTRIIEECPMIGSTHGNTQTSPSTSLQDILPVTTVGSFGVDLRVGASPCGKVERGRKLLGLPDLTTDGSKDL